MPRILTATSAGLLSLLVFLPLPGRGQDKKPGDKKPDDKKVEKKLDPKDFKDKGAKFPGPVGLRKYEDVITSAAKTSKGIFTVHRIEDKIYFEIPEKAYGKYFLWMAEVAKASNGAGWGGKALGNRVVRWARRGNKVLLWQASFQKRSDGHAIERAVESADQAALLMSFNVETEGKDKSPVIAVNGLFTSDVGLVSGPTGITETFVEAARAFPTNVETRLTLTYRGGGPVGGPGPVRFGGGARTSTVLVHYSMTLLPERPMRGRYFDPRVGYFTRSFEDYGSAKDWMQRKEYIARFRLEKKDPQAAVSEPVKPIVFYLSREVPEKWRPYLMKGVEDWKPAFEKAGFRNAIMCKQAPTVAEDPAWDPEDARYSVIRWVADPTENAMGPHVHDPRSGEIISAHVIFWHNITKLAQQWYFVQCAGSDERARKLPLPDDVTGELLRYIAAHEVGHTLGLRHNHRASSAYTTEQLRDPVHCEKYGTVASIMAYGRFNYVAQPEDRVKWLIPKIGPYDFFAIDWGYRPIPEAKTARAERPTLDKWAARQMDDPWLRFGGEDGPSMVDPTVKTENIGRDSVQSTALGLKNLDRVTDLLVPATTSLGEDFALLNETYQAILKHRFNWFRAVALNVGGVVENRTLGGRGVESFTRVTREKQQEAVRFLLDNAFTTPRKLLQPALVNRIKYVGVADGIMGQQKGLLLSLLSGQRFRLLMDAEVVSPEQAYSALQFLSDVQDGIWSELKTAAHPPTVDPLRRALQRAYLDHLRAELNPKDDAMRVPVFPRGGDDLPIALGTRGTDFRAVGRAALTDLATRIDAALPRIVDPMTRVHLQDCRREIELILNPKG